MIGNAELHNRLEQLADVARAAYDESHFHGSVADGPGPEAHAALGDLRAALVDAGYSRRHADWAVTGWLITRRPVLRCVAETNEDGSVH